MADESAMISMALRAIHFFQTAERRALLMREQNIFVANLEIRETISCVRNPARTSMLQSVT